MTTRLTLTIFQKMLIAPLVGVLLYSAYLFNIYDEQRVNRQAIEQIRSLQLPVMGYASENVRLFDTLAAKFKDAVLANEQEWVASTRKERDQIDGNLAQLARFGPIVGADELATVRGTFTHYYDDAFTLAQAMLRGHADSEQSNRLIENVERYHGLTASAFARLHSDLYARFSQQIDEINERLQRQVMIAAALGVVLIVVTAILTVVISLSTRKALRELNAAFRNMAQETPDFSRRLQRAGDDELGELVGWFNQLADKLEANYQEIEQLSIVDKLTQLYNRAKIDDLLTLEVGRVRRQREPLTVIIIDLDHFKTVNDSFGHLVGDAVLRELAEILRQSVRSTDHVGRWGGEEFIVLLPATDLANGCRLAEKLRANIAAFDFSVVGHKTASFGVATFNDGDDADTLIKRADDCLYAAKHGGRDRVVAETVGD